MLFISFDPIIPMQQGCFQDGEWITKISPKLLGGWFPPFGSSLNANSYVRTDGEDEFVVGLGSTGVQCYRK